MTVSTDQPVAKVMEIDEALTTPSWSTAYSAYRMLLNKSDCDNVVNGEIQWTAWPLGMTPITIVVNIAPKVLLGEVMITNSNDQAMNTRYLLCSQCSWRRSRA